MKRALLLLLCACDPSHVQETLKHEVGLLNVDVYCTKEIQGPFGPIPPRQWWSNAVLPNVYFQLTVPEETVCYVSTHE